MPKAHIVSVDRDEKCLEAAIDAGANDVIVCDDVTQTEVIEDSSTTERYYKQSKRVLPAEIRDLERFDVIALDLCGIVSPSLKQSASLLMRGLMTPGGAFILTFSYGRDVAEMFSDVRRKWEVTRGLNRYDLVLPDLIPDHIVGRINYLFHDTVRSWLRSVMIYKGAQMPMCSLLLQPNRLSDGVSFVRVGRGDFELAVCYPDSAGLYDCPQDRIESLRRKHAAVKASYTRAMKPQPIADSLFV